MAFIHRDRLSWKYGWNASLVPKERLRTQKYEAVVSKIIEENNATIDRRILEIDKGNMEKTLQRFKPGIKKTFILPDITEVLPKRSIYAIKAAESGKAISDTIRQKLGDKLRQVLKDEKGPHYIRRRGIGAGTLNPKAIANLEKGIREVFETYTKKDPKLGIPSNIHTIAVTEIRTTVNNIKRSYIESVQKQNPGAKIKKEWIQNKMLTKEPRRGHSRVNGSVKELSEKFQVPVYNKIGKRYYISGYVSMSGPHDETASKDQKIGCQCELKYTIQMPKEKE